MRLLDKFFGRKNLEPKDLANKIGKLMDSAKTESVYRVYVPSRFRISLSIEDMERLSPFNQSVNQELIEFICGNAKAQDYHLLSEPEIQLETRDDLEAGYFEVEVLYEEDDAENTTTDQFDTMVFGRNPLKDPNPDADTTQVFTTKLVETPILEIISGHDQGLKFRIKDSTITLGRKEENQVVLHDPNISRFHARIFYEQEWQIEDLNSTNGVFVNGKRVKERPLQTGDQIRVGSTLMKFLIK